MAPTVEALRTHDYVASISGQTWADMVLCEAHNVPVLPAILPPTLSSRLDSAGPVGDTPALG